MFCRSPLCLRPRPRPWPCQSIYPVPLRAADFSQSSRRQEKGDDAEQAKRTKAKNSQTTHAFAFPALVLFAVGIPLGWYIQTRIQATNGPRLSSPNEFVNYTLIGKESVSSTCAIFRLKPSSNTSIDLHDPSLERAITSAEFKQPQLQIARSYTCLPQQDGQPVDELRFLIRKEQKGEVSNFLHGLPINAQIEVRGLHAEHSLPEDVKSVVFLVGGTGIAPAIQAADTIDGDARIYILWANRRREDCVGGSSDIAAVEKTWSWWPRSSSPPADVGRKTAIPGKGALVVLLESLKNRAAGSELQPSRLLVDYYIDEEGTFITPGDVKNALTSLSREDETAKRVLFVSGPAGFINHWAGPKQWANGRELQGPLKGVLSTMDLKGWDVIKL